MSKHFPWLDLFRFSAALLVLIAHSRHIIFARYSELDSAHQNFISAIFFAFTRLGNEAVLVFFVLSGFLVGGLAIERIFDGSFDVRRYFVDRFTRIYVPLIPAILLTIGISLLFSQEIDWVHVLGNVASLQGVLVPHLTSNDVLWTLSYEVWFYIGAGALGLACKGRLSGILLLGVFFSVFLKLSPEFCSLGF